MPPNPTNNNIYNVQKSRRMSHLINKRYSELHTRQEGYSCKPG